jgi:threonine dehydrogenase-like Zn-dependent dehydrogenase
VPKDPPDARFVYLSDVLPTAWQAVRYAGTAAGQSLAIVGLGPIGEMCARVAMHLGATTVVGLDLVPERLDRARRLGITTLDVTATDQATLVNAVRDLTHGRGPDAVIDAVGLEAHGSPVASMAHRMTSALPASLAERLMNRAAIDRMAALHLAIELVRRGGTISITGVYGGLADPLPMRTLFDKQITVRMGQANVRAWIDELLPLVTDADVLGVEEFATHRLPLSSAPDAYEKSDNRSSGMSKVIFEVSSPPLPPPKPLAASGAATTRSDAMADADVANGEGGVLDT